MFTLFITAYGVDVQNIALELEHKRCWEVDGSLKSKVLISCAHNSILVHTVLFKLQITRRSKTLRSAHWRSSVPGLVFSFFRLLSTSRKRLYLSSLLSDVKKKNNNKTKKRKQSSPTTTTTKIWWIILFCQQAGACENFRTTISYSLHKLLPKI